MTDYSKYGFAGLKIECREKGIEVTDKDTAGTLRKKLTRKPKANKK